MKKQTQNAVKPFTMFFNVKGVDQDSGVFYIQPDAAEIIENMNVDTLGQWSTKNQGFTALTAQMESGARVDSLAWFRDDSGADYLVTAINGKINHINESTGAVTATISSSFTAGQQVDFQAFSGKLYAASQGLAVQKWTGSGSMSAASGWPLVSGNTYDKPKLLARYANRMVFANFNGATAYPSHVVISDDLAPETFTIGTGDTNGVILQVSPGDGQHIVGLLPYNIPATNTQTLFIFKNHSIYTLDGDTPSTFDLNILNDQIGAVNNSSIVQVGTDVLFLDHDNIYSLTTATSSGTIQPKALGTDKVKSTLSNLNLDQLSKCWAIHIPGRREVWFAIPTGSNTECDTIIQFSYKDGPTGPLNAWSIRKNTTQTCGVIFERTFLSGSSTGYINEWHNSNTYNGTGIAWKYKYPYFNFSTQAQNKRVVECYAWFLLNGEHTINVRTEWRGGGNNTVNTLTKTLTLADGSSSVYGGTAPPAGVYGTNIYGGGTILKKVQIPVLGNGEQLQFTFSGTTSSDAGPIFLGVSGLVQYMGYSRRYN